MLETEKIGEMEVGVVASGDLLWHSGKRLEESAQLSPSCALEKSGIGEGSRAIMLGKSTSSIRQEARLGHVTGLIHVHVEFYI